MTRNLLIVLSFTTVLLACSDSTNNVAVDAMIESDATAAACATSTLTYANFGEQFFTDFCTTCHASDSASRRGAPSDKNWDTLPNIMAEAERINIRAGIGTSMPPGGAPASPSAEDRDKLAEWILCGTP